MSGRSVLASVIAVAMCVVGLLASDLGAQAKGDATAGEPLYKARCASCHGAAGAGDGKAAEKMKDKPKDWTKGDGLKGLSDQQLFDVIKQGGPAIGRSKTMIAFPKLSDGEVWNLVAFVKRLSKA